MNTGIRFLVCALFLTGSVHACFDTYLFLQKGSMVYPEGEIVVEGAGEYTVNNMGTGDFDLFSGSFNAFYGAADRFSLQMGISSAEKQRTSFEIDEWGIRGVYNLISNYQGGYNLDVVLEHHSPFDMLESMVEISTPNTYHMRDFTFVVHPVLAFGTDISTSLRGHGGAFYRFGSSALIGVGAEFESAQSSSHFGERLVESETATSLFLGARIGQGAFFQNEFIKGWGKNSKDFGYAATVKVMIR
ncbi:MAG: hypothetical protein ACLFQB_15205 [Chitinispirillaceae bacterium]